MIALLVALIGAIGVVLAAVVPYLIGQARQTRAAAEEARTSSDAHGPTLDIVAAGLNRLEGKVDVIASLLHVHGRQSAEVVRLWDASDNAASGAT